MAAVASAQLLSARPSLAVSHKRVSAPRVNRAQTLCRAAKPVASSVENKQQLALPAGVTAGIATMMAHPLAAEATSVTPSLRNLLGSVAAGGAVLAAIIFAVSTIASFDPVARGRK